MIKGVNPNYVNRNNNNNMRNGGGNRPNFGGQVGNRPNFQQQRNLNQNRPYFKHQHKPFIPHVCFDFIQAELAFQRVKPERPAEEKAMADALIKRNQDLTPTPNEQSHLLNMITKVQTILDNIILSPGDFDACQIDEIRQVGSFKKNTMLMTHKLTADLCVVLKTLPTKEAVNRLTAKVYEDLKKNITNPLELSGLQALVNERGFEILSPTLAGVSAVDVSVQVMVTTQQQNIRRLDPALHLDAKVCQLSLNSIKHARWFEENASHSTIKVLIRILKDIRNRFEGLQPLNPWMIELMAHHAIMNNPKREALPLVVAFKRVFQLISAGFFLPGSAGIIDPCEQPLQRVHTAINLEQQDLVCFTAQTLLRVLAHGGFSQIIGQESNASIATSPSVWAGIVVIPSAKAYEPPKETEPEAAVDDQELSEAVEASQDAPMSQVETAAN